MRVAFLIVTYTNPAQTKQLVEQLAHPDFHFYIHLDKKFPLESHKEIFELPNVFFIKDRVDVKWAGFSTIQCILNSFEEILATKKHYDFIHLMSGQDFPVQSTNAIHSFLSKNIGKEFIEAKHFYTEWKEAIPRIELYHLHEFNARGVHRMGGLLNAILPKRKCPLGYEYYGKSMFWTISLAAAFHICKVFKKNWRFKMFVRFTWAPDEFIIPTILMNSPLKNHVVRNNLLYVDMPEGTSHPKLLDETDFPIIQESGRFFARKFKIEETPTVLNNLKLFINTNN